MNTIYNIITIFDGILDMTILYIFFKKMLIYRNKKLSSFLFLACFLLIEAGLYLLSVYFGNDYSILRSNITTLVSFLGIFAISFFYEATLRHRFFVALLYQIFCYIAETLIYYLFVLLAPAHSINTILENPILGAFCSKIVIFLLSTITILLFGRKKRHYSLPYTFLLLITPIISIIILLCLPSAPNMSDTETIMYIIAMTGVVLINFINYFLLENVIKVQELEQEKLLLTSQFAFQANKYQQISNTYRSSRSIIHDTKKHFFYIQECVDKKEYDKIPPYLKTSIEQVENTYNRINTGNLVIDSFVSNHLSMAEQQGIGFRTNIKVFKDNIQINDYDLCIILGNLLDNCLEACQKIIPPEPRQIEVELFTTDFAFVIHLSNTVSYTVLDELEAEGDANLLHGYGTKNVNRIALKNKGTYLHFMEDHKYHAVVTIPCNIPKPDLVEEFYRKTR